jgi:uncharacterized protein (DUF2237 family)
MEMARDAGHFSLRCRTAGRFMADNHSMNDLAKNVLGGILQPCSTDPMTGYFRTGDCQVTEEDVGNHGVCIIATEEFLRFSRSRGNDLSTPMPEYDFPGVKPGDRWCLCSARWQEALQAGMAPHVVLESTSAAALLVVKLADLKRYAVKLDQEK